MIITFAEFIILVVFSLEWIVENVKTHRSVQSIINALLLRNYLDIEMPS